MREFVFSDQVVLFSGRRVAILLIALGGISLFSGLENFIAPKAIPPKIVAQMLEQSRTDFSKKRYAQVISRCRSVVKANPDEVEAWSLLVETYSRLGEKDLAREGANVLLRLDPNHSLGKSIFRNERERIEREKESK